MRHGLHVILVSTSFVLAACGPAAPPKASDGSEARPVLAAGEVAKDAAKYAGQKIAVSGVYTQGYSMGGRDGDPWALVIRDAAASSDSIACVVAAKVDVPGSYPKIVAEGTLEIDPSGPGTIKLTGCTYALK